MTKLLPWISIVALIACGSIDEFATTALDSEPAAEREIGAAASDDGEPAAAPEARDTLLALARPGSGSETVCRAFSRAIAEAALESDGDVQRFLTRIRVEFVDGDSDPFALKAGLRDGRWNQDYFYAGHGGFRPDYDDARRYPNGGNHQPGHFISVLSIAADFGEEQARLAIAFAGDYEEGDEDDLRLSNVAIPLGAGLRDGSVAPGDVAVRARELCRS